MKFVKYLLNQLQQQWKIRILKSNINSKLENNSSKLGRKDSKKKFLLLQKLFNKDNYHIFLKCNLKRFKIEPTARVHKLAKLIRSKLKLEESDAIAPNHLMQTIYEKYKEEDGLLYVNIASIETFGNNQLNFLQK